MFSSMKPDLKSSGRVPASSAGRSLLGASPLKTKIQVVTDLPKATQGFSDRAETDSTRVYFHGTWVFRCWMLHLFRGYMTRSLALSEKFSQFFFKIHKPEPSLYLFRCSLYLMHLLVPWKVSYGWPVSITHITLYHQDFISLSRKMDILSCNDYELSIFINSIKLQATCFSNLFFTSEKMAMVHSLVQYKRRSNSLPWSHSYQSWLLKATPDVRYFVKFNVIYLPK